MEPNSHDQQLWQLLEQIRAAEQPAAAFRTTVESFPQFAQELRELWPLTRLADELGSSSIESRRSAADAADSTSPSAVLTDLPDYDVHEELGRGGMGIVYRGTQRSLDRTVAIKVCRQDAADSSTYQSRLRREADTIARLHHPHIVQIYDVGAVQDQFFIVMQYVAGHSLSDELREGPLEQRRAAEIVRKVALAMQSAHEHGVLHRDLKPSNILIDAHGEPVVTDFGLAKPFLEPDSGLTYDAISQTGVLVGTPGYMAPEQALGAGSEIGAATDVYGLGAVLYALLTGRPPLQANSPLETLRLSIEQDPVPPRLLNPLLHADLELITLKCLQKPPELRYASAAAVSSDLMAFLTDEPISARSSRFREVIVRLLRETHHAPILHNWGLLWMWHAVVLLLLCVVTNFLHARGLQQRLPYAAMWSVGLTIWAGTFWSLRRRAGPTTFVERQIAHVWGGSVIGSLLLFFLEWILDLPVLSLSPVLGLISGSVFLAKAGILSGQFYLQAGALYATSLLMAWMSNWPGPDLGISLFGAVSAACFFLPGLKYVRATRRR